MRQRDARRGGDRSYLLYKNDKFHIRYTVNSSSLGLPIANIAALRALQRWVGLAPGKFALLQKLPRSAHGASRQLQPTCNRPSVRWRHGSHHAHRRSATSLVLSSTGLFATPTARVGTYYARHRKPAAVLCWPRWTRMVRAEGARCAITQDASAQPFDSAPSPAAVFKYKLKRGRAA